MARIFEYEQRIRTPAPGRLPAEAHVPAGIESGIDARAFSAVGRGARDLAFALKESEDEQARAWSSNAISKARLDWTNQLVERQDKAAPGAPNFQADVIRDFDEYANKVLESAPNSSSHKFLSERLADLRTNVGNHAIQYEAQARVDYRDDQLRQGSDNAAKLMNTTPEQYAIVLAEQLAIIDASSMPQLKKSTRRETTINQISQATVWSQIQRSPTQFLESIGFYGAEGKTRRTSGDLTGVTGNLAFDALPFDKRTQMFESAVRSKAQLDIDGDRATKEQRAKLADDAMKEGWSRFYKGALTSDYIESIRPLINDNEYRSLLEARRRGFGEGGQKTDPGTYRELQRLIATDKFHEAVDYAFTAHRNGRLSNEHLGSEVNRARSQMRQEGPKSEYERTRRFISGKLDPGPMVPDPIARGRLAEAMDAFDRWHSSGPRTDEEVMKRGREIVDQYALISFDGTILQLPVPRGTAIRRQSNDIPALKRDIAVAATKLKRDRDAGVLSPTEYANETSNLARWLNAVKQLEQQQVQPGKK